MKTISKATAIWEVLLAIALMSWIITGPSYVTGVLLGVSIGFPLRGVLVREADNK